MTPAMQAYMDANQPCTADEIAKGIGCTPDNIRKAHYKHQLHITAWQESSNGRQQALYVLGQGADAPRPKGKGYAVVHKAYRQRHNAIIRARRQFKNEVALGPWRGLV